MLYFNRTLRLEVESRVQDTTKCKVHTPLLKATLHNRQVNGGLSFIMKKNIDLVGNKYNYLTVINYSHKKNKNHYWLCVCDCGKEKAIRQNYLLSNYTISCGCYNKKKVKETHTKHGLHKNRLYNVWLSIKTRCYNKNFHSYYNYGGRGITVCDEWKNDFMAFYNWAMKNGYKEEILKNGKNKWTLDRINNDSGYSPENCRWVDMKVQSNNTRVNHKITYKGETLNLKEMAKKYNLSVSRLSRRLSKGWSIERAIEEPINKNKIPKIRRYENVEKL